MDECALNGFLSPAQRTRFAAAVSLRSSVRTFSGAPDVAQSSALHYAAARLALPGVRLELMTVGKEKVFVSLPGVDSITGTDRYAAVICDPRVPHAEYHAGISGEAFVLEAVSLGLGTCWLGSFRRGNIAVELQEGERIAAIIALGVPAESEAPKRKRKTLQQICRGNAAEWPLWAYNAAECVRNAPSAVNLQPWRLSFAGRTLLLRRTFSATPLVMGIAMLHMSLGAGEKEHVIRWGERDEVASLVAEDRI